MNILIVDDEKDVKLLFQMKFRKEIKDNLIHFLFAYSAEEALSILNQHADTDVVLILSDINMPGMSGLDLLKMIKEKKPNKKVMMVTAYGDQENMSKAADLGADHFVTKPIDFVELKEKMLALLKDI